MLRFVIPIFFVASVAAYQAPHSVSNRLSAASPGQIKFAIENKYDHTGPGAKEPETAYHTYKHLDDALVAYLDDPDTQLSHSDKTKALKRLYETQKFKNVVDEHLNPINMYTGIKQKAVPIVLKRYKSYDGPTGILPVLDMRGLQANDAGAVKALNAYVDPYRWQKEQAPKKIPLRMNVYSREGLEYKPSSDSFFNLNFRGRPSLNLEPKPQPQTAPNAGHYTYVDARGQTRTVYYHTDDRPGYRSYNQRVFNH